MNSLKPYAKAIVPLVIGFLVTVLQAIGAGKADRTTLLAAVSTLLTSASVYFVPNAQSNTGATLAPRK